MKKRIFSILTIFTLLFSCAAFPATAAEETEVVRFGVFSDTHGNEDGINTAFDNIYALSDDGASLDGVVLNGDIIYVSQGVTPEASEYEYLMANEKYQELKEAGKIVYEMGNHEFPLNSQEDATLTQQSFDVFKEQTGFDPQMHTVMSGYHFINAAPENYAGGMQHAESYMKTELEEALADGTEKPVFLIVHHPVPSSVIDSPSATSTRFSVEFREFLNNQPRIVVLSGHTHEPESDPRSIRQYIGGCTYVQTSHISGGANVKSSYATESHSKKVTQALMMEIEPETNVLTFKRFYVDSAGPEYLEGEDWVIDIPAMIKAKETEDTSDDLAAYKYTFDERQKNSTAPHFEEGAKATVSNIAATGATVTFPKAFEATEDENDLIKFYEIKVYDVDAAQLLKTNVIISDFFLKESERRSAFSNAISGLTQGTNYKLEICATTTWYKKSVPITVEFQTLSEKTFDSVTLDAENTFTVAAADISNDTGSVYHRGSYIQVPATANKATFTATFEITNPGMYRFMASSIGSNGAQTKAVISKVSEEGEKTVLETAERYVSTGGATTYVTNFAYADIALTEGTYAMSWSIVSGDTTTLNGLKVGKFGPLPSEYLEEYVIEKTAADYSATSETVEEGAVIENFTLNKDGYVSWSITPDYTGIYKLSYDFSGEAKTTVTSADVEVSANEDMSLPADNMITPDGELEFKMFTHVTYEFKLTATADNTVVNGMNLTWQSDFTDLENDEYSFSYACDTELSYGNINITSGTAQPYIEKSIVVPYDANYTLSLNAGAASSINAHVFVERAKGGTVSISATGATDTIANHTIFEDVPLKGGIAYKISIFNGTSGKTLNVSDIVLTTSGEYSVDIDDTTFLASDYTYRKSGLAASMSSKHRMALTDNYNMSYKLKVGAGNYKVYGYIRTYTGSPTARLSLNSTVISNTQKTWESSVTKYDLGTIRVTDDEFTLNIAVPNTTDTTRLWFYRFQLVAVDEPDVIMYKGENTDLANITTSLEEGSITAKAYLPKEAEGKDVTMFLSVYEDNRLYKTGTYSITGKKNSVTAVTLSDIVFEEGKTYTTKIFFWNNEGGMTPLYNVPTDGIISGAKAETEVTE